MESLNKFPTRKGSPTSMRNSADISVQRTSLDPLGRRYCSSDQPRSKNFALSIELWVMTLLNAEIAQCSIWTGGHRQYLILYLWEE